MAHGFRADGYFFLKIQRRFPEFGEEPKLFKSHFSLFVVDPAVRQIAPCAWREAGRRATIDP
jgi:hypothetical protein